MNGPVEERRQHYLNVNYGLKSWLLTVDHKRIAWLYLVGRDFFLFRRWTFRHADSLGITDAARATWCRRKPTTSYSPCMASR